MTDRARASTRLDCTALIPAAGPVPVGLLTMSPLSSPAMIPVAGRPVVHWTIEYLLSLGISRFRMAVPERGRFVESYVDSVFGTDADIEYLVPSANRGPGFTVHELADGVRTAQTLVVLGDTFFRFEDPAVLESEHPFVVVSEVDESYRWCIAETDGDGTVTALRDKEPGLPGPHQALIGAYWFPSSTALQEATTAAVAHRPSGESLGLAEILAELGRSTPISTEPAGRWIDCGNPDRQVDAQRALLAERAFNELSLDEVYGTITKRSRHVEKFLDEIDYLRLLPRAIEVLFPRLLDYDLDPDDPSMTMEFYGYPTLSELFVFQSIDAAIWRRIFRRLDKILFDGFGTFERAVDPSDTREMFLGKVLRRRDGLDGPPELLRVLADKDPLVVNGVELRTLPALVDDLEIEVARLAESAHGSIIHGDLCFSNVLYDPRSGIFKLIDPRGSYGRAGIYGDLRYDVAKLCHSVIGDYDFITADLFRAEVDGDEATLEIRSRPEHAAIRAQFEEIFFARFPERDILLITGLVLLGLPALHFDSPRRQVAFALRGLQMVDEALRLPGDASEAPERAARAVGRPPRR